VDAIQIIDEQQVQPIPLTTAITPLADNQTTDPTPAFSFTANSTTAANPTNIFFQVDTWQGPWIPATGAAPSFSGTLPRLQPGLHILYAFAADGQEANSIQAQTLLTGTIQAYQFLEFLGLPTPQTIAFPFPGAQLVGTPLTLAATASSGLPVSFTASGSCTVSNGVATFAAAGDCSILASQPGNATYAAAPQVQQTFPALLQPMKYRSIWSSWYPPKSPEQFRIAGGFVSAPSADAPQPAATSAGAPPTSTVDTSAPERKPDEPAKQLVTAKPQAVPFVRAHAPTPTATSHRPIPHRASHREHPTRRRQSVSNPVSKTPTPDLPKSVTTDFRKTRKYSFLPHSQPLTGISPLPAPSASFAPPPPIR
jgi:hypothetical protein